MQATLTTNNVAYLTSATRYMLELNKDPGTVLRLWNEFDCAQRQYDHYHLPSAILLAHAAFEAWINTLYRCHLQQYGERLPDLKLNENQDYRGVLGKLRWLLSCAKPPLRIPDEVLELHRVRNGLTHSENEAGDLEGFSAITPLSVDAYQLSACDSTKIPLLIAALWQFMSAVFNVLNPWIAGIPDPRSRSLSTEIGYTT